MTCCCTYKCEQGRDCPIRKQRIKEVNKMYTDYGNVYPDLNPYEETLDTFKDLVAVVIAVACITLLAYVLWGTT